MIIKGILELFFSLLQIVFSPIALPQLPAKASSYLDQLLLGFQAVIMLQARLQTWEW